jgi:hypothetical protein
MEISRVDVDVNVNYHPARAPHHPAPRAVNAWRRLVGKTAGENARLNAFCDADEYNAI